MLLVSRAFDISCQCESCLMSICYVYITASSPFEKSRYDTSLGLLTRKFVGLLQNAPEGVSTISHHQHFFLLIFNAVLSFVVNVDNYVMTFLDN